MLDTVKRPLVGVPCCCDMHGIHRSHLVGEKYIRAAIEGAGAMPVLIPAFGEAMVELLPSLDGLLLTGSYSNMEPHHYGAEAGTAEAKRDPQRDATNLSLIGHAVEQDIPMLGICRGFQEMNVAFGGSLHEAVQEVEGMMDHREDKSLTLEEQYAVAHKVRLNPQGRLAGIMEGVLEQWVNSLHMQGVNQLGEGLLVEATAPDGLVEAFSVKEAATFMLGVQWHPEWRLADHPFYQAIFTAFGKACRERSQARQRQAAA